MAIASGDPIRVFKWTLWSFPVLVVFVLAVYIYDRRKSGSDQRPNTQGIVRQFLPSTWAGLSRNDYVSAAVMVLSVAVICFFALYALTP